MATENATMSIALDTCFKDWGEDQETIEGVIAQFAVKHGVTGTVVDPSGPAGGWPIVEWTGTREQLKSMLKEHYASVGPTATDADRDEDAEEMLAGIG